MPPTAQSGALGSVTFILHAHLPFVRHPENPRHLEEEWLFEAIIETYIPVLDMLERLQDEGVDSQLGISISPTLAEMLADPLLQERFNEHLGRLRKLMEREVARHGHGSPWRHSAHMYHERFERCHELFNERWSRDILGAFARLQDGGRVEILTTAATHGVLPLMQTDTSRQAQLTLAQKNYKKHFGRPARGLWLPESAYAPGLDQLIHRAGFTYTFVDTHGLLFGQPRPRYGIFRPVRSPSHVVFFARDVESSKQIWSRDEGYPGDFDYREFYRDLGFDAEYEYVRPYLHEDGVRRNLGIKYHRITGPVGLHDKSPYNPQTASRRAREHAEHFLESRQRQVRRLSRDMDLQPVIVCPYDAELFGHWWFEGPQFLEHLLRGASKQNEVRLTTPSAVLDNKAPLQPVSPCPSSWGDQGYYQVWLNERNEWIYPDMHRAEKQMNALAADVDDPGPLQERALNQAARELMLAQASDWAFLMTAQTNAEYAGRRTREHLENFTRLHDDLRADRLDEPWLSALEDRNNAFGEMDWRIYRPPAADQKSK